MPTGLVSTRLASTRLARFLFLLLIGSASADGSALEEPTSIASAETPREAVDRIAVFTLIRGGASESDYEMFRKSRECVHDGMAGVQYDNIAFHEGNVPAAIQTILGQKMCVSFELLCTLELRLWNSFMNDALYRYTGRSLRASGRGLLPGLSTHGEYFSRLIRHLSDESLSRSFLSRTRQCHFMSMIWFRALRDYKYAMRVDEDVCISRLPRRELMAALEADYAFGLETTESHQETLETFLPWLREYMDSKGLEPAS
eukprot:6335624-Prymnesium_polylepis.1